MTRWESCPSDRVLVIDYDDLWTRTEEIARHLRLDGTTFAAQFPPRATRTTGQA
ncbi:hypothetical protein [Alteraurantiacibacter buctensis]|uniref:Uncharacterized protein n=1 Tax=Alteraurantiacibacter buctensis TaxID=1503981 RepID=A0A844YPM1_9SPHN|nr:hypothetical protein [Alteraurantiacibacter buctensis]MXO70325.1 hypothetical protein [Alteraurantiacibacter buctensis]